jgi:hypothetical protein
LLQFQEILEKQPHQTEDGHDNLCKTLENSSSFEARMAGGGKKMKQRRKKQQKSSS